MGKVIVIESKSTGEYLRELGEIGEDLGDYESVYGYSMGHTEPRMPIFEYPPYEFQVTDELTNFVLPD
jgi:lysine 2,3-aminomutase